MGSSPSQSLICLIHGVSWGPHKGTLWFQRSDVGAGRACVEGVTTSGRGMLGSFAGGGGEESTVPG